LGEFRLQTGAFPAIQLAAICPVALRLAMHLPRFLAQARRFRLGQLAALDALANASPLIRLPLRDRFRVRHHA
jgi:hypothetical protein